MALDAVARAFASQAMRRQPLSGVEVYGADAAAPAGSYQNTAAFRDALPAAGPRLTLAGERYALAPLSTAETIRVRRASQQPVMMLPASLKLIEGRGATLHLGNALGILGAPYATYSWPEVRSDLGGNVVAGSRTLTVAAGEGAKWAAGDTFVYRFGSLPYDLPEPLQWGIAKVRQVTGDVLTLDVPMPEGFVVASVAAQTFTDEFQVSGRANRTLHKWPLITDLTIRDLTIIGNAAGTTEIGLYFQGARRVTINNVTVSACGNGITLQYVDGAVIDGCTVFDSSTPNNASLNKGIALAETRAIEVRQLVCSGVLSVVNAEANAEATFTGGRFHNTGNPADGTSYDARCIVFSALGRSTLMVRDFTITGHGGYVLAEVNNGNPGYEGRVRFEGRLTLIHATMPVSFGRLADMHCLLDLRIGAGRELWDFPKARWFTRRIWLKNGEYQNFGLPPGILRQARVYTSPGLTPGIDLIDLYIGRAGDNGASHVGKLVAGRTIDLPGIGEAGAIFNRRAEQLKLLVITATGSALDAGSQFIDVACEIVPDLLAPGFVWSSAEDARNLGAAEGTREARFSGYDLPAIAAGAVQPVDFAIPEMGPGDLILSASLGIDRAGLSLRDIQAIAGKCRITFENRTAAAIDLPATILRILWRKPPADS